MKKYNHDNLLHDIKQMKIKDLQDLADHIRQDLICNIAKTGGHLGSNLGVVELSLALHHCFNSPIDKIIWDVSHQSYVHKMLTGRYDKLSTIRQTDGMSGFSEPEESEHDHFIAGHASTSISSAIGVAKANSLKYINIEDMPFTIAIIGDGALSSGLALEGLNNSKDVKENLIIIVNDNNMSISKPTGAMSDYLKSIIPNNLTHNPQVIDLHNKARFLSSKLPSPMKSMMKTAEKVVKNAITDGMSFNTLGFHTINSVDGHDIAELVSLFNNIKEIKDDGNQISPILIHIKTTKGKGYLPAESSEDKMHGVGGFNIDTGVPDATGKQSTCSTVVGQAIAARATKNKKTVAVTAAMGRGVGLYEMSKKMPNQFFDVGIAEGHAVTFAAGMAVQGINTSLCIYSTFLQRAYDNVIHDVALGNVPLKIFIDRAGFVGADGKTHAGIYDISYLANVPHFTVMAPADNLSLHEMTQLALDWSDGPIAMRYPKGSLLELEEYKHIIDTPHQPVQIGKSQIVRHGQNVAVIAYGQMLMHALNAAEDLKQKHQLDITVVDARFVRPLDTDMLNTLIADHDAIITVEAGVVGGFGSLVAEYYLANDLLSGKKLKNMHIPFNPVIDHKNTMVEQYKAIGLNSEGIVQKVLSVMPTNMEKDMDVDSWI